MDPEGSSSPPPTVTHTDNHGGSISTSVSGESSRNPGLLTPPAFECSQPLSGGERSSVRSAGLPNLTSEFPMQNSSLVFAAFEDKYP